MLVINLENTDTTELIKSIDKNIAVINLAIVNYGDTPADVNIYAVPNGKQPPTYDSNGNVTSGNPECTLIQAKQIDAGDTLFLNLEKFLLHQGDSLHAQKLTDGAKVSIHVIYEEY